jgi:hypothetical protein
MMELCFALSVSLFFLSSLLAFVLPCFLLMDIQYLISLAGFSTWALAIAAVNLSKSTS